MRTLFFFCVAVFCFINLGLSYGKVERDHPKAEHEKKRKRRKERNFYFKQCKFSHLHHHCHCFTPKGLNTLTPKPYVTMCHVDKPCLPSFKNQSHPSPLARMRHPQKAQKNPWPRHHQRSSTPPRHFQQAAQLLRHLRLRLLNLRSASLPLSHPKPTNPRLELHDQRLFPELISSSSHFLLQSHAFVLCF